MGITKEFAKSFYKSAKWKKCRKSYIDSRVLVDGGVCEMCKEKLGYIVHHKIPLTPENINDEKITDDSFRFEAGRTAILPEILW